MDFWPGSRMESSEIQACVMVPGEVGFRCAAPAYYSNFAMDSFVASSS